MRLSQHLPDFMRDVPEYQELNKTFTAELQSVDEKLDAIQSNQFIETADGKGLSRYEMMLRIVPSGDIDTRRFNILTKFNSSIPFTMGWLHNLLRATLGASSYLIELDNFHLNISIPENMIHVKEDLTSDLRKKIPANLTLEITVLSDIKTSMYVGCIVRSGDIIKI